MSVLWSVYLAVTLVSHILCSLSPENEVPLHTATWLSDGKITQVHLIKGHTHRLHFTLRKKTPALTLTVSPCSGSVEWSLTAHSLKDKTAKEHYWSFKKSEPEVWWRKSASEKTLYTYSGSAVETYMAPALHPVSVYTLRITATQEDTHTQVYLHEGFTPLGVFPELPFEPQVHVLGVGMSSVTLTWSSSPSVIKSLTTHTHAHTHTMAYVYCVTMNRKHNYRSLCAAQEEKGGMKDEWNKGAVDKLDNSRERVCVCEEVESVCTVSELQPNTLYYFDVFVVDKINSTSAAYTGTVAHTHAESRTHADLHTPPHTEGVTPLREGQVQWVTLSSGAGVKQSFRFRPRGGQKNGLLTLLSCNDTHTLTHTLSVSVSARGNEVTSQEVGDQLVQVWLQGYASYLIQLRLSARHTPAAQRETVCVKMQASSAFHRRGAPALPHTLHIKSFNTLRTCSSVTLAWMGTEERGLYCLYRRRVEEGGETGGHGVIRGRHGVTRGRQTGKNRPDREMQGRQAGKNGPDGVTRGRQTGKNGPDGVTRERQTGKNGPDGVTRGRQTGKNGPDGVTQGRQTGKNGPDGVTQGRKWSKYGPDEVIWGKLKSETGGVKQDGQRRDTDGDRGMQDRSKCARGRDRVRWSATDQEIVMCSDQKIETSRKRVIPRERWNKTDQCLAPESRPPDQRVLCKYFQELDARRAVTTATVGGLEAETLYIFDIYLMRRWALPVKYHSKMVRTRRDC